VIAAAQPDRDSRCGRGSGQPYARLDDHSVTTGSTSRSARRHPFATALINTRYVRAMAVSHAAFDGIMMPSRSRVKPSCLGLGAKHVGGPPKDGQRREQKPRVDDQRLGALERRPRGQLVVPHLVDADRNEPGGCADDGGDGLAPGARSCARGSSRLLPSTSTSPDIGGNGPCGRHTLRDGASISEP
jgi:hypothetical protein